MKWVEISREMIPESTTVHQAKGGYYAHCRWRVWEKKVDDSGETIDHRSRVEVGRTLYSYNVPHYHAVFSAAFELMKELEYQVYISEKKHAVPKRDG